jgi:hypothetical protein
MFYDFTVFHSEQVVKCVFFTTIPFTFAYCKHEVAFTQYFMDFGVFKHIVLRSEILYCFHYASQSVFNLWVVLMVLFGTDVFPNLTLDFYPLKRLQ